MGKAHSSQELMLSLVIMAYKSFKQAKTEWK